MGLTADLTSTLDSNALDALAGALTGTLSSALRDLGNLSAPAGSGDLDQAGQASASVDTGGITAAVTQIAGQLTPLVSSLPGAGDVLRPITGALETVEALLGADLPKQFQDLAARLATSLNPTERKDPLTELLGLFDSLTGAPETSALRDLLNRLAGAVGIDLPASATGLADLPKGVATAVRVAGGLMSLETVLSEAGRLTRTMSSQLDRDAIESQTNSVLSCFGGSTSLADFLRSLDVTSPAQVEAAVNALRACSLQLWGLVDAVKQGMAFGEATIVYLDVNATRRDVASALALVREADLGALERALSGIFGRLPQLTLDPAAIGQHALEDLLARAEGKLGEIRTTIESFDAGKITAPITGFLGKAAEAPKALTDAIGRVNAAIRAALDQVRAAVSAIPIDTIVGAIRQVLDPIAKALEFIGNLVKTIKETLGAALKVVKDALDKAEGAIDDFTQAVETIFQQAADFIHKLNLNRILGEIADNIKAFSDLIAKAQLKPYFDTATGAIDTAAGIVEKVPFSILPDSMESDVVAVCGPIKAVDLDAFRQQILDILEIGPDGKFRLRPDIENAVAGIQAKYNRIVALVRNVDPKKLVEKLDQAMKDLADRVQSISPQVELAPLQEAIDKVRATVGGFDVDQTLKPLRDGFDTVLAAVDEYSPTKLLDQVEARVTEARQKVLDLTHLSDVEKYLDDLSGNAKKLIGRLDASRLEQQIEETFNEILQELDKIPQLNIAGGLGAFIAGALGGAGMRLRPRSFEIVFGWVQAGSGGGAALSAQLRAVSGAVTSTRQAVEALDPQALSTRLAPVVQGVRAAVASLPAGPERGQLQSLADRLDPTGELLSIGANRQRYLAALIQAEGVMGILASTGVSEVDASIARLRAAFGAVAPTAGAIRDLLGRFGIHDLSVGDIIRRILAVAPPERLAAMVAPVLRAVRDRLEALVDSIIAPLKDAVQQLIDLVNALDLKPLRDAVDQTYQALRGQIAALHPDKLLGDIVKAFKDAQKTVADFDPLADIQVALTALRDAITRVLGKLKPSGILATPISLYEEIVGVLEKLDLDALLTPLYDQIDGLAQQVDQGLKAAVDSFQRLQDALPSQVGSTSLTASASAGGG